MQPAKAPARASISTASVDGNTLKPGATVAASRAYAMSPEESFSPTMRAPKVVEQARDQLDVPGQAGLGGEVIEIDRDRLCRGRLHDGLDIGDEPVVRHALVVEGRQHQRAGEAELGGMPRQRDRVRDRGRAGADHEPVERQAAVAVGASSRACVARARTRSPRRWCRARSVRRSHWRAGSARARSSARNPARPCRRRRSRWRRSRPEVCLRSCCLLSGTTM